MGFHPTIKGVLHILTYTSKTREDYFEHIDYLQKDLPLDELKESVACYQPQKINEFIQRFGDRLKNDSPYSWNLYKCENWGNFELACETLGFDKKMFTDCLFTHNCYKFMDSHDDESRNVTLQCLKYNNITDIDSDYLKFAIKRNDLNLAGALVRAGANPERVRNWKKKCSKEMYQVIMNNL